MRSEPLSEAERVLRDDLLSAPLDSSAAAQVVSRAATQGRRAVQRRRRVWAGTGGVLVLATAGTVLVGSGWLSLSPTAVPAVVPGAGGGSIRTVPDAHRSPAQGDRFVVDPEAQRAAGAVLQRVVAAAVPGWPTGDTGVSSWSDPRDGVVATGWAWSSVQAQVAPATMLNVSVDQRPVRVAPVVSECEAQQMVTCAVEVLADGTRVVSGTERLTIGADDVDVVATPVQPFATATRPDGRVIEASAGVTTTSSQPLPAGSEFPADSTATAETLRQVVISSELASMALPRD